VVLGMSLAAFTLLHVVISLVGIGSGFVVVFGLLAAKRLDFCTAIFLWSTVLTSATGFLFPFHTFLPSHGVGILSLIVLAVAILARYKFRLAASWRWIYVICASVALYFNVFVLVIQAFLKVPALQATAPTQSEPPFVATQATVLLAFVALTILGALRFRGEQVRAV
jgi:hypothetical protein